MAELFFNGILAVLDIVGIFGCFAIEITDQPLARYWPMTLLLLLLVMLAIKMVGLVRNLSDEEKAKCKKLSFLNLGNRNIQKMVGAFAVSIVYAFALGYVGYIFATVLFGVCMAYLLGGKCWWKNILTSVVITFVLYAIFTWGLGIHPARGIGFFAKFSKWVEYLF